jgi:glucoamylase
VNPADPPVLALAPGGPGIPPRWTGSAKDGVGAAYAASSRLWFTLSLGVINEVYYPTIDRPQLRDLQFIVTDGTTFAHGERRHTVSQTSALSDHALGFHVRNVDRDGRYAIIKDIIADPHQASLLIRASLIPEGMPAAPLRLFVLAAPHLEVGGWGNSGRVANVAGRTILAAWKGDTWLALASSVPFLQASVGYVGVNDGWTDLSDNFRMDWAYEAAYDGNIALTAELGLQGTEPFTLGLALGDSYQSAVNTVFQALNIPFAQQRGRFIEQWDRASKRPVPLERAAGDGGRLCHMSRSLLLAHEDKTYPGAMIASLSIPWGSAKGDEELGGYHLVWTRDLVHSATGLLAAGDTETALRALIYLATVQHPDGGFYQNFWLNGEPYWRGIQLDEVAFPVLLAWRLHRQHALREFDPYPMILRAAGYLVREGPATAQERWEEAAGFSPSTLASNIAALVAAAQFARERADPGAEAFMLAYADFLEAHVERWTVTTQGTVVAGIPRHYIRVHPVRLTDPQPDEDPNAGWLRIPNRPPGARAEFPAKEIVDAGFLELVRYGIRRAGDPLIEDSLRVIDSVLRVETPLGPAWRRYPYDGYGQRPDGGPFEGWGQGRAWPLLTGERGHYELAAGGGAAPFIRTLERFAHGIGLLPEQIWDEPDRPALYLRLGRPTGSAMPLMWAHAEYLTLLRSALDGAPFELIPEVAARYTAARTAPALEVWKFNRQIRAVPAGATVRVLAAAPFRLHWTVDEWRTANDTEATAVPLGLAFVDVPVPNGQQAPLRFTFYWPEAGRWEGRDFAVVILPAR